MTVWDREDELNETEAVGLHEAPPPETPRPTHRALT
jgi:hypothetical protein